MEKIIVIRAADPDGSAFKAVVDALKGKRTEVAHVADPASSVLRYRRSIMSTTGC